MSKAVKYKHFTLNTQIIPKLQSCTPFYKYASLVTSYLGVCDEQTVGVLMLTGNLILRQHVSQLLDEGDHFLVPGDVCHCETAGRAFPAVCHSLDTQRHFIRNSTEKTDSLTSRKGQHCKNKMENLLLCIEEQITILLLIHNIANRASKSFKNG